MRIKLDNLWKTLSMMLAQPAFDVRHLLIQVKSLGSHCSYCCSHFVDKAAVA